MNYNRKFTYNFSCDLLVELLTVDIFIVKKRTVHNPPYGDKAASTTTAAMISSLNIQLSNKIAEISAMVHQLNNPFSKLTLVTI